MTFSPMRCLSASCLKAATMLWWLLAMLPAFSAEYDVQVGAQQITFSTQGGVPVQWVSCYPDCESDNAVKAVWFDRHDGSLSWTVPAQSALTAEIQSTEFELVRTESERMVTITMQSRQTFDGQRLRLEYALPKQGYRGRIQATGLKGLALSVASGVSLIPEQLPGFGSIYSKVRPITMAGSEMSYLEPEGSDAPVLALNDTSSIGIRSRYWLWLASPDTPSTGEYLQVAENQPVISLQASAGTTALGLTTYTGPTELSALNAADPTLKGVLFSAIWNWLRYLSFGLLFLLEWLQGLVGNYGVAIVLLSLTVKILMFPLTYIADQWQAQVNATSSLLKPKLDAIKREFKGEEAHNKVLAVYRDQKVSQFYTLRSLFGFLIQIPVFIAAFDMLAESFVLGQASFLWISDLAKPDHFAALPFVLPFFGGQLNLLPFAMTALTIVSAIVQEEADLTPDLMRQQRIKLFLMAVTFFLLFYTFPAGMVLYWTANNLFHLLKILPARLLRR